MRDSALRHACSREGIAYIGIAQKEDFLALETQEFLKEVFSVLQSWFRTKVP